MAIPYSVGRLEKNYCPLKLLNTAYTNLCGAKLQNVYTYIGCYHLPIITYSQSPVTFCVFTDRVLKLTKILQVLFDKYNIVNNIS